MKKILVTGADGALGSAVCHRLAATKNKVFALGGPSAADEGGLKGLPAKAAATADLSSEEAAKKALEKLAVDKLDAMVLVAGGYVPGGLAQGEAHLLSQMLDINLLTAWNTLVAGQHLLAEGAHIVLVSARAGAEPAKAAWHPAYAISKNALFYLADMLPLVLKDKKPKTRVLVPETIDTPANRKAMPDADFSKWTSTQALAATVEALLADGPVSASVAKVYIS